MLGLKKLKLTDPQAQRLGRACVREERPVTPPVSQGAAAAAESEDNRGSDRLTSFRLTGEHSAASLKPFPSFRAVREGGGGLITFPPPASPPGTPLAGWGGANGARLNAKLICS